MNCRPGDLAVIVRVLTCTENIGGLVRVLEPADAGSWYVEALQSLVARGEHDDTKYRLPPGAHGRVSDRNLRPLRDDDGDDETLTWAGRPRELEKAS
jgi:hypothetical protein